MLRGSVEAAGIDVSALQAEWLLPGKRTLVPIESFKHHIHWRCSIYSRSGLAFRHNVVVWGMKFVDGHQCAIMENLGTEPFKVVEGMRVAQYIADVRPLKHYRIVTTDTILNDTARGLSGFGSSGLGPIAAPDAPLQLKETSIDDEYANDDEELTVYVDKSTPDMDIYYGAEPFTVQLPTGTFGLVTTAEGAPWTLFAGVIDSDYRGKVAVKILKGEEDLVLGQFIGSIKVYRHGTI